MVDQRPDLSSRISYDAEGLEAEELGDDPLDAVRRWLADAERCGTADFNAMVLATVDAEGQPTARNVLLRGIDDTGRLRFFTNRLSRKGRELAVNPRVGLLFTWVDTFRQVRIEGVAELLGDAESDEYFATRPRDSQLSAWVSEQSQVIESRSVLEQGMNDARSRFEGRDVARPPYWGGYAVLPHTIEFWQGRPNRLHDRIRFHRGVDDPGPGWVIDRLAP